MIKGIFCLKRIQINIENKLIGILNSSSADGNYEVTLMTKATVYYDGRVIWEVRLKNKKRHSLNYFFLLLATSYLQIKLYNQCGIFSIRLVYFV